jgi:hypothetical protein
MTASRFTVHQDVAAVEHDEAGNPVEGAPVFYGTVTEVGPCSVTARIGAAGPWPFLLDSRNRAWREAGRWRLVPLCRCELPILGEPVTDPDDPLHREFCSGDCLTTASEVSCGAMAAIEYSAEFD